MREGGKERGEGRGGEGGRKEERERKIQRMIESHLCFAIQICTSICLVIGSTWISDKYLKLKILTCPKQPPNYHPSPQGKRNLLLSLPSPK